MFKMAICPHDSTKNKVYWLYFVSYLREKTGLDISAEQCLDFECYYKALENVDLSYSNPLDALRLKEGRKFIPVAGNDKYDEVVIIAQKGKEKKLEDIDGKEVACVENQFATFLGMKILKDKGISFKPVYKDSWQGVLNDVSTGKVEFGFLYKDFWDQLSELSKAKVEPVFISDEKLASHVIMISPEIAQQKSVILSVLEGMKNDPRGKEILENLRINEWYPLDSLEHVEKLIKEVEVWR